MKKLVFALTALMSMSVAAVTGDYKLNSITYSNSGDQFGGDIRAAGTINRGAIQSGGQIVLETDYEYSFEYSILVPGKDSVAIIKVCNPRIAAERACQEVTEHTKGKSTTVIAEGSGALKAITQATTVNGRLNPKGKVTGFDWAALYSVASTDAVVDLSLIPAGGTLVPNSVEITKVGYSAYLIDGEGAVALDTFKTGTLFG
jgi:hypothetical protein